MQTISKIIASDSGINMVAVTKLYDNGSVSAAHQIEGPKGVIWFGLTLTADAWAKYEQEVVWARKNGAA